MRAMKTKILIAEQNPADSEWIQHELKTGISNLTAGIYLVKVQVGDKAATRRLEITH